MHPDCKIWYCPRHSVTVGAMYKIDKQHTCFTVGWCWLRRSVWSTSVSPRFLISLSKSCHKNKWNLQKSPQHLMGCNEHATLLTMGQLKAKHSIAATKFCDTHFWSTFSPHHYLSIVRITQVHLVQHQDFRPSPQHQIEFGIPSRKWNIWSTVKAKSDRKLK